MLIFSVPMSERHANQIREQWDNITRSMNPAALAGALYTSRVLTLEDKELIDLQRLNREKNEIMLGIILKKADWTYQKFIDGLQKTEQYVIVGHLQIPGLYTNYFQ